MTPAIIRIGTSGYSYSWNRGKPTPFEWYLDQEFNSVEINASFYRFPTESWVRIWCGAPDGFTFSIKVHRSITHYAKLKGSAEELLGRFMRPLRPIDDKIEFWLFQLPSQYGYSTENMRTLEVFFQNAGLGNRAVVEFRDPSWWNAVERVESTGVCFCSADAPGLPRDLIAANGVMYLRLHGRERWYDYEYSLRELDGLISEIRRTRATKKAIYLNNDHGMLPNGGYLLRHLLDRVEREEEERRSSQEISLVSPERGHPINAPRRTGHPCRSARHRNK